MEVSNRKNKSIERETESEELDDLLVDYLESMEVYVRTTLNEENLLREGFINIAHARMCLKPHLLSLDGFPSDSSPDFEPQSTTVRTRLDVEESESKALEKSNSNSNSNKEHHHLHRALSLSTSKEKDAQLRKIFGQSTPASLKKAQETFRLVLEQSIERANIMNSLKHMEGRILEITSRRTESEEKSKSGQSQKVINNSSDATTQSESESKSKAKSKSKNLSKDDDDLKSNKSKEKESQMQESEEILKIQDLNI